MFTFLGILVIFGADNASAEYRTVAMTCDFAAEHCEGKIWGEPITLEQCLNSQAYSDATGLADTLGCSPDGRSVDLDISTSMEVGL